jgi:hypothetical protein
MTDIAPDVWKTIISDYLINNNDEWRITLCNLRLTSKMFQPLIIDAIYLDPDIVKCFKKEDCYEILLALCKYRVIFCNYQCLPINVCKEYSLSFLLWLYYYHPIKYPNNVIKKVNIRSGIDIVFKWGIGGNVLTVWWERTSPKLCAKCYGHSNGRLSGSTKKNNTTYITYAIASVVNDLNYLKLALYNREGMEYILYSADKCGSLSQLMDYILDDCKTMFDFRLMCVACDKEYF